MLLPTDRPLDRPVNVPNGLFGITPTDRVFKVQADAVFFSKQHSPTTQKYRFFPTNL
jgi:hypothetical protein